MQDKKTVVSFEKKKNTGNYCLLPTAQVWKQAYEVVEHEGVRGRRLRPAGKTRVQGQQEAGLLRATRVNQLT